MECPKCGKFVRCLDSRKKLSYVEDLREGAKAPVRERKYVCAKDNLTIITREFIFSQYPSNVKDKRIQKKKKK